MLISKWPIKCHSVTIRLKKADTEHQSMQLKGRREEGLILAGPPHHGLLPGLLQWVPHWSPSVPLHPSPPPGVSTQQREVHVQLQGYDIPLLKTVLFGVKAKFLL